MTNLPSYGEDVTSTVNIRSYGELQARLRAMQYNEPVGVDSAPLVKRLLGDVVRVSERNDALETELEKAQREAIELSQIILPLRKENAKLTRENNSLHLEIIHQEESISDRERQCELQVEQLKDELSRLQYVNTQKAQALNQKDLELTKLHAQLERLVATGATSKSQQPGMEMRGGRLSQSHSASGAMASRVMHSSFLDKSAVDDAAIISELQNQLRDVTKELKTAQQESGSLKEKLQHREKEIERLAKVSVERATAPSTTTTSGVRREPERAAASIDEETRDLQIDQLSAQVDLLNSQVAKYEARLKSANDQIKRSSALQQKLEYAEKFSEQVDRENKALQSRFLALEMEHVRLGRSNSTTSGGGSSQLKRSSANKEAKQADHEQETDGGNATALNEQIDALTSQNERLEDALRATHYDKISFTNALSNANSHNRVLTSDLERCESKANEVNSNYTKSQQLLADATARVEVQARELDVLRESLQQVEQTRAMESEKNAALHRELRAMDKVVSQRDEECRTLHHELSVQKRELDRVTTRLDALKRSVEKEAAGDQEESNGDKKKALYAQEMKWLEDERCELRQSREELVVKVLALEQDLQATKMELQTTQLERDDMANQLSVTIKSEQSTQQQLDSKKQDAQALQRELLQWKERAQKCEDEVSQAKVLLQRADQIENEKIRIQNELLDVRRRLDELRDQNASLKNSLETSDQQAKRFHTQLQELQEQFSVTEKASNTLKKEQFELTRSYENATVELRNVRQLSQHYQNEYEKLMQELQENKQSRTSDQSALQNRSVHVSDLTTQLRQLQNEIALKQNVLHQVETRLDQEKMATKTLQSQLLLATDENVQLKDENRSMETTLRQLRDDLKSKDKILSEKTASVENMKLLMEQMETSRDQILFKLKQEQQHAQRHQMDHEDLEKRLRDADQQAQVWQGEIASLKKLTRTLDSEKDHVHDQLDLLTEKFHEIHEQNEKFQQQAKEAQDAITSHQQRMAQMVEQLGGLENTNKELEQKNYQLDHELENLRHAKAMADAELRALDQDLENMTMENQALSEECTRLQFASQRGDQSSSSLKNALREVEKERDILAVELEDAQQTYRSLVHEQQGTHKSLTQASATSDELATVNDSLRKQLASLANEVEVLKQKNATLATETSAYRDQISFLTDKLRTSDDLLSESDHKYAKLRQEFDSQKQVAQEISAQRYGAQAQNAAVSQRIVHLENKLSTTQFELKTLQEKLQQESSQRASVEGLVVTLRHQAAAKDATISHLEEQRDAMAQEIRVSHQRLVSANAMEMSELSHSPAAAGGGGGRWSSSGDGGAMARQQSADAEVQSPDSEESNRSRRNHDETMGATGGNEAASSSSGSLLPLRALEMAQRKCQELEERLASQDDTIQQLERSRSKFKRFAAKYEREIESRDRVIGELRSSHGSSSAYPSPLSASQVGQEAATAPPSRRSGSNAAVSSSSSGR